MSGGSDSEPRGQVTKFVYKRWANISCSIHDNDHEDRMWAYECTPLELGYDSCSWSGYVNNYDEVEK